MINYKQESTAFVNAAFELLDERKNTYHFDTMTKKLHYPFYLRVNSLGQLSLWDSNHPSARAHTYMNKKATPITSVGILLAKYLEFLETEIDRIG